MDKVKVKVLINTIDKVKKFAELAGKHNFDIDLATGRYVVDAKSIMGIFSLNLIEEMDCIIYTNEEDAQKFINTIDTMIVKSTY